MLLRNKFADFDLEPTLANAINSLRVLRTEFFCIDTTFSDDISFLYVQ